MSMTLNNRKRKMSMTLKIRPETRKAIEMGGNNSQFVEKRNKTEFFHGIPEEEILNILSRLPVKIVIKLSCVCKLWFSLIHHDHHKTLNNHYLSSSHFLHYSLNNPLLIFKFFRVERYQDIVKRCVPWEPNPSSTVETSYFYLDKHSHELCHPTHKKHTIQVLCQNSTTTSYKRNTIGYCNGLFCFFIEEHGIIEVYNPSRRQILAISAPQKSYIRCFGFGIDTTTKEYKILCVFRESDCMVFTLGGTTDSWREIKSSFPDKKVVVTDFKENKSVFCNGTLYWNSSSDHRLVAFNLQDEKFHVIQLPPEFVFDNRRMSSFVRQGCCDHMLEFKGSLCLFIVKSIIWPVTPTREVDLYTLNNTSTNKEQEWIKKTFYLQTTPAMVDDDVISYSGQLLFYWTDWADKKHNCITIQNLHTGKQNTVHKPSGIHCYEVTNHVENFLSLETFVHQVTPRFRDSYPCLKSMELTKERSGRLLFLFSSSQNNQEPGAELCY